MNHLIFDVETTGFYNPKLLATDYKQARVIQLACIKLDNELNEIESFCSLIKPEPWYVMNEGAFKAHGISLEEALANGQSQEEVIKNFIRLSHEYCNLVAHNYDFDSVMVTSEVMNLDNKYLYDIAASPHYCTMKLMTPVCKLPHKVPKRNIGGSPYKWPKLEEAIKVANPSFQFKAHNALEDCRATAEIYKFLVRTGRIKFPSNI